MNKLGWITPSPGRAYCITSVPAHNRWLESNAGAPERLAPVSAADREIVVLPQQRRQTILGFGGALTDAAASVFSQLSPQHQQELLQAWLDPEKGNHYRLLRIPIGSCDFSLRSYSFCESAGDYNLNSFSLDPAQEQLLPVLHKLTERSGELKIIASPWSPPPWMKTNGEFVGGKLRRDCLATWAGYLSRFVKELAAENIPIWAITVQNEPSGQRRWESCAFSPDEERDFIKFYLWPRFVGDGLSQLKVFVADHNRDEAVPRAELILSDPGTARCIAGVAVHWYSGNHFSLLARLRRAYPELLLLNTEACIEGKPVPGRTDQGIRYAHDIIGCLLAGCNGWMEWNLLLNMEGGPNHADNPCDASILADTAKGRLWYQSGYYFLGHFSRYFPAGSTVVALQNRARPLEAAAVCWSDGTRAVTILNPDRQPHELLLREAQQGLELCLEPESIITVLYQPGR